MSLVDFFMMAVLKIKEVGLNGKETKRSEDTTTLIQLMLICCLYD